MLTTFFANVIAVLFTSFFMSGVPISTMSMKYKQLTSM